MQRSDSISREKTVTILPKLHDFYEEEQGYRDHYDFEESDEDDFLVTEASHMISSCDIALVKTGNDYPCYLVELICYTFTTESETKDHYNHTYPPEHKIVIGNYLEIHIIFYLENKRKAIISCFSNAGVSPESEFIQGKRCGKTEDVLLLMMFMKPYVMQHSVNSSVLVLKPFQANGPPMEKPGGWFLLAN